MADSNQAQNDDGNNVVQIAQAISTNMLMFADLMALTPDLPVGSLSRMMALVDEWESILGMLSDPASLPQ